MKKTICLPLMIILIAFLYAGCNKTEKWKPFFPEEEVHLPGEYFPAFPKTWWEYQDQHGRPVKYKISNTYEACEGAYSPVFLNIGKCIYGPNLIIGFTAPKVGWTTAISPIYSTHLNDTMWCPISMATFKENSPVDLVEFRRITTKTDTSITLTNNDHYTQVIVVEEYSTIAPDHKYIDYFAKDVGLIKRDSVDVNDPTQLITILTLEDYFIGENKI